MVHPPHLADWEKTNRDGRPNVKNDGETNSGEKKEKVKKGL